MNSIVNQSALIIPELNGSKIRKTPDGRFSVYDLIRICGGQKNPRDAWKSLCDVHSEVVGKTDKFQFEGKGQRKTPVATIKYIAYIEKFYYDSQFNVIYNKWIENDKDKWLMPSIDHINPKANGGNFDLGNLRFISWFENRAKADMSLDEWEKVKSNISYYFV